MVLVNNLKLLIVVQVLASIYMLITAFVVLLIISLYIQKFEIDTIPVVSPQNVIVQMNHISQSAGLEGQ